MCLFMKRMHCLYCLIQNVSTNKGHQYCFHMETLCMCLDVVRVGQNYYPYADLNDGRTI